jgi:hypothetical protein
VVVGPVVGLLNERGGKTMCVCFVVNQLRVYVVVDLGKRLGRINLKSRQDLHSTIHRFPTHQQDSKEERETYGILEIGGPAKNKVLNGLEEGESILSLCLEVI